MKPLSAPRVLWIVTMLAFAVELSFGQSQIPFSISIPDRTGSYYPTGEVKITLQLSGAPGSSSLDINWPVTFPSSTTQTVSFPGFSTFATAPKDKVILLQQPGNLLVVEYFPLSQFQNANDYCDLIGLPKFPYQVSFVLHTANTVTVQSSAVDSYSAAGYPTPTQLNAKTCGGLFRRIGTSPASLNITGSTPTRGPLDVVLVLDESGSMSSPPTYPDWSASHQFVVGDAIQPTSGNAGNFVFICTSGGTTGAAAPAWPQAAGASFIDGGVHWTWTNDTNTTPKWNILQQAVGAFVATWTSIDTTIANDRIGLAFYNTSLDSQVPPNTIFYTRTNWAQVTTEVGKHSAGGATAMGHGLKAGICKWKYNANNGPLPAGDYCNGYSDAADGTAGSLFGNDPTVVLMTDGLQNVDPCIVPDGTTGCFSTSTSGGINWKTDGDTTPLWQLQIPVSTIGLGVTSGTVPFDVLDGVSNETGGIMEQTATASTATTSFANSLVSTLKGNTLSILGRTAGALNSSSSAPLPFTVDASIKRVVLVLSWQGRWPLDLQIVPPGGCGANGCVSPVMRTDGQGWTVQAIDFPTSGPAGDWSAIVVPRQFEAGVAFSSTSVAGGVDGYQLSVYAAEGKLEYRFNVPQTPLATGGSMSIAAEVSYGGAPLTGLGNAITVHVDRPGSGVGTFLHNNDVPDSVLQGGSTGGDSSSPYESKLLYLSGHSTLLNATGPQPIPTVYTLRDSGSPGDGDTKANDGIYSAVIGEMSVPGEYVFTITMDWTNSTTGHVHRTETIKRQVQVSPDPGASIVKVASGGSAGQFIITIDPVDKFGNYLGPGYVSALQVQVSGGGTVSGSPNDARQTGAYGVTLTGVPPGTNPVVTINVGGKQIRKAPLNKLQCQPGKPCCNGLKFPATMFLFAGVFAAGFGSRPNAKKRRG